MSEETKNIELTEQELDQVAGGMRKPGLWRATIRTTIPKRRAQRRWRQWCVRLSARVPPVEEAP